MNKKLIVYYSMDGNTEKIAMEIKKVINADIVKLDTVIPYTGTDEEIVQQGKEEVNKHFTPQLKPLSVNLSNYDTIILGTPTWWYTMAPAVLSFIKQNDLKGKTIIPFQTHAGWPGHGMKDIEKICKDSHIINAKKIQFSATQFGVLVTSQEEVNQWIETLK